MSMCTFKCLFSCVDRTLLENGNLVLQGIKAKIWHNAQRPWRGPLRSSVPQDGLRRDSIIMA